METIKLTQEELDTIKKFQKINEDLNWNFGQIESNIIILEIQKEKLKQQLAETNEEQNNFAKELNVKYGNGTIRVETGEFVPN